MQDSRPTVEDVARAALAAVDSDVGLILAGQFVGERYASIAARTPLRTLHRVAMLTVPAVVDAGTITVVEGSTTVTGDAEATAAWGVGVTGRELQLGTTWYRIFGEVGSDLTLDVPYVGTTLTAGSYRIVRRYHALADDARTLGDFTLDQRWSRLRKMSQSDLDYFAPSRRHLSYGPTIVVDVGVNAENARVVELYPYPQVAMVVRYDYWAHPPRLELTDAIPGSIDLHMLKEGVLIDVMRHLASRAAHTGDYNGAGYWRNEARAQESRWESIVNQSLLNDRGIDDVETRMRSSLGGPYGLDIMTARDEIWSRGLHP